MKEIVDDFCKESMTLFAECKKLLEDAEDVDDASAELEKFGQTIDRVMGAAKSMGADEIGLFCELGKVISYKSSQVREASLLNIVVAVLFDAVDIVNKMVQQLHQGKTTGLDGINTQAFVTRLKWLSEKFKNIDRASCAIAGATPTTIGQGSAGDQVSLDDLINSLGLK